MSSPAYGGTVPDQASPEPRALSLIHQRIGRYRILDELAQGGMGVVYLAEQSEPVQRRVALKLIRAGLDSAQVLARFEAERKALALMNHPNIAAIFDAGSTPGGYPYFVMEFVPGKDIKSYCDDAKLSLRARIRLFLQICDGVLHAHQKGVIHRDLKPSNILVGQKSDHSPLVKLIDFGVAKSLTGGLGAGLHTRIGSFVGTPVYSSPEQVIDPTRDIDTRADLYSLGVVLYELLAGIPPRSAKDLDADTPAELARRLRDTKTPPMDSRYASLDSTERQRIAELRALSSEGLSMQLGSDLDWIVGKCIAQDPDDRYATVQDLRLDLQRWLDDRPVEARPASTWYRFRKMIRRNRVNSTIIISVTLAFLAASMMAFVGFRQAERQALLARAAAADAVQVARFQERLWTRTDAGTLGSRLRERVESQFLSGSHLPKEDIAWVTELLREMDFTGIASSQLREDYFQTAMEAIDKDYAAEPHLQHQLRQSIAESMQRLGIHDLALAVQNTALEQRRFLLGPQAEQTLDSTFHRGVIYNALGEDERSRVDFEEALEGYTATLGPDHPSSRLARYMLAYQTQTNVIPEFREALANRLATHGGKDPWTLDIRIRLARELASRGLPGDVEEAANLTSTVLAASKSDQQFTQLAIDAISLKGRIALTSGDFQAAVNYYSRAHQMLHERLGGQNVKSLESAIQLSKALIQISGQASTAESLLRGALSEWTAIHGANNGWSIWTENFIASAVRAQGRIAEAIKIRRQSLEMLAASEGSTEPMSSFLPGERAIVLSELAEDLTDFGDFAGARKALADAAPLARPDRQWIIQTQMARLEHHLGNHQQAELLLQKLLEELDRSGIREHWIAHEASTLLAIVYRDNGRVELARQLLQDTWPKQIRVHAVKTLHALAELEYKEGNKIEARKIIQRASEFGSPHLDPNSRKWLALQSTATRILAGG